MIRESLEPLSFLNPRTFLTGKLALYRKLSTTLDSLLESQGYNKYGNLDPETKDKDNVMNTNGGSQSPDNTEGSQDWDLRCDGAPALIFSLDYDGELRIFRPNTGPKGMKLLHTINL